MSRWVSLQKGDFFIFAVSLQYVFINLYMLNYKKESWTLLEEKNHEVCVLGGKHIVVLF